MSRLTWAQIKEKRLCVISRRQWNRFLYRLINFTAGKDLKERLVEPLVGHQVEVIASCLQDWSESYLLRRNLGKTKPTTKACNEGDPSFVEAVDQRHKPVKDQSPNPILETWYYMRYAWLGMVNLTNCTVFVLQTGVTHGMWAACNRDKEEVKRVSVIATAKVNWPV